MYQRVANFLERCKKNLRKGLYLLCRGVPVNPAWKKTVLGGNLAQERHLNDLPLSSSSLRSSYEPCALLVNVDSIMVNIVLLLLLLFLFIVVRWGGWNKK